MQIKIFSMNAYLLVNTTIAMQTHWLFINVNIDDNACYACRIVASPNVVFQGSKASKRTAFYSHFLFKEAFTWWNCNKRKEVRYDRSIFSLNSYKIYRNDDRMFKTQVQSVFTSLIRSITMWASRSLSGMVFSIYEVVTLLSLQRIIVLCFLHNHLFSLFCWFDDEALAYPEYRCSHAPDQAPF